jgi:hypothetical protein
MSLIQRTWAEAEERAHDIGEKVGIVGYGVVELFDRRGDLILARPFANLVTDAGDQYIAKKIIAAIGPANPSAPTAASGMKLGTGTTAAAKASTGGALGSYISGSNAAFDSGYAQSEDLGAGNGYNAVYKSSWAAGTATNSAITEAVIANDAGSNATSTAANTYSRTVFTAVDKQASDTLAITWKWKALGA